MYSLPTEAFQGFRQSLNITNDTILSINSTASPCAMPAPDDILRHFEMVDMILLRVLYLTFYTTIFVLGILGNVLVCLVVIRNKAMQTVTNLLITNLAISDICLCLFAVTFTPLYAFNIVWVFGEVSCRLMPFVQGCSVYISTFTLMLIAIDRFFVIIYPFRPRMKITTCLFLIANIWCFSILLTTPYGVFMQLVVDGDMEFCTESWPSELFRRFFGTVTIILQFALPFMIMAFCYYCVSARLNKRAQVKARKATKKENFDNKRKQRTNQMLIAMVMIFGISWSPLHVLNIIFDYNADIIYWKYYVLCFFSAHLLAMSSTCYNPFIYAWLNENFRKEFKQVLPCFDSGIPVRTNLQLNEFAPCPSEKTFNGNTDTYFDSMATSSMIRAPSLRMKRALREELNRDDDDEEAGPEGVVMDADVKHCHISSSYNLRRESVKLRLINEESFVSFGGEGQEIG